LNVRVCRLLIIVFAALILGLSLQAQAPVFDATLLRAPSRFHAQWLVHAGDDPAYADPGFDDSHWTPFDPSTSIQNIYGKNKPEVIWYRLRVKVDPTQSDLALGESGLCNAFEIYANGERILAVGSVKPFVPYTYVARVVAPVPNRLLTSGSLVIALRAHFSQADWRGTNPGYDISNLNIGQFTTLQHEKALSIIGEKTFTGLDDFLEMGLGIIALVLFTTQRSQKEYLWIFAAGVLALLECIEPSFSTLRPIPQAWVYPGLVLRLALPLIWGSLYLSFVRQRIGWRWRTFLILAGISNAIIALQQTGLFAWPQLVTISLNLPVIILFAVVIPILLAVHWRRGNREAGILLIPAVVFTLYIYAEIGFGTLYQFHSWQQTALRGLNLIDHITAGPFTFSLNDVSDIGSVLALAIIILRRSSRMSRRQAQLESELEAAQQVQQVLVPETTTAIPGFAVEAVYLPAQQVGGDFFQVLPAGNGGLLVVVGDVAGKGLPAAMLVSALVGSIRTAADDTHAPELVLHRLNERLAGRTHGGFATALAAYIAPNGAMTIANAGHLSPYLDGKEIELPGALPLGIASPIYYETVALQVPPGSRLTFYSDGVIEAQNSKGELFGFDRSRDVSTQPAGEIAETARRFGQEDDITVVTIARDRIAASAA
jgi:sigma-B regulation protein RsbU (phosphoserine phosphatase)